MHHTHRLHHTYRLCHTHTKHHTKMQYKNFCFFKVRRCQFFSQFFPKLDDVSDSFSTIRFCNQKWHDGSKKITTKILFQKLNLIKIHFLTSEHLIRLDFFSAGRGGGSAKVAGASSQPRGHEIMSWAVWPDGQTFLKK